MEMVIIFRDNVSRYNDNLISRNFKQSENYDVRVQRILNYYYM